MSAKAVRAAVAACALAAFACGAAGAAGERDALIARWIAAAHPPASLRAQLDAPGPVASEPPDLSAMAAAELKMPGRYRLSDVTEPPKESWFQRALDWARDRVADLWQRLTGRIKVGRAGAMAFGDVLIALSALAVAFGAWRLLVNLQLDRRRSTASQRLDDAPDARAVYARAQRAARDGDLALASRLLFVATVLALDLRGVVASDPSATVGDLRRVLRSRDGALVPPFDAVASPFVRSAYAERPVAPGDWEVARSAFLAILPEESPA